MRYVEFIQADPFFYDRLRTDRTHPATTDYRIAQNVDWAGWEQNTRDGWHGVFPRDLELPEQGWKVHVSATLENAQCVLDLVSGHCGRQRVPFKYRATRTDLLRINLKYADRGTSGKFVTVYPATEQACAEVLNDLDALVGGMDGPTCSATCAGTRGRSTCGTAVSGRWTYVTSTISWCRDPASRR